MPMKSLVTGGITIGVTDLVPTVDWVLGGCRGPVPASLSSLIAGLLAVAFHAGVNWYAERTASRSGAVPPSSTSIDVAPVVALPPVAPAVSAETAPQ